MADTPAPSTPAVPSTAATFGDAQGAIDAQNRQLLAVMAGVHTQGDQGYQAQQAAGTADKQAALQQLLASAIFKGGGPGSTGVPPAADPNVGNVGAAFDQRIGTTGQLGAAFDAASQARSDAAGQYMREATAAVPIVEARTNEHIATLKQEAQAKAAQQAMANQLDNIRLQIAQADLAKSQGAGQTPAQIIAALGGQELAGQQISDAAAPNVREGSTANRRLAQANASPGDTSWQDVAPTPPFTAADSAGYVGQQLGLSPDLAVRLAGNAAQTDAARQAAAAARGTTADKAANADLFARAQRTTDYPAMIANVSRDLVKTGYAAMVDRVVATHQGMPYGVAELIVNDALRRLSPADQKKVQ